MEERLALEDDDALEREYQRAHSPPRDPLRSTLPQNPHQPSSLTFSFPGWGVQIFRDSKRRKPSIIRHSSQEDLQVQQEEAESRTLSLGFADDPGTGRSVYEMPTEIMINIFKRLSIRDLCSAMHTCHWWQHLGSQDDVWQQINESNEIPIPLPRSQILLRYGLRRILQSGYMWLICSDANGLTSESEVDLLQSIRHLLQEVDVRDDTLSTQPFTQTKMRRCFPVRRLSDGQTRHTQEKNRKLCCSV